MAMVSRQVPEALVDFIAIDPSLALQSIFKAPKTGTNSASEPHGTYLASPPITPMTALNAIKRPLS